MADPVAPTTAKTGTTVTISDHPYWWAKTVEDRIAEGCQVTPLIDGEETFREIHSAMMAAKKYVLITAWSLAPDFPLLRTGNPEADAKHTLKQVMLDLGKKGVHCFIMLWDGWFFVQGKKPSKKEIGEVLGNMSDMRTVHLILSSMPLGSSHHQKTVVVDGTVAFCGGFDFSFMFFDRWDTQTHKARDEKRNLEHAYWFDTAGVYAGKTPIVRDHVPVAPEDDGWHDIHAKIEGPAVKQVDDNFRQRWKEAKASEQLLVNHYHDYGRPYAEAHGIDYPEEPAKVKWPEPPPSQLNVDARAGSHIAQVVRTFPDDGEESAMEIWLQAVKNARRYIYIENQYFNDPKLRDALVEAIEKAKERKEKNGMEFRIVVVLPIGYETSADTDPFAKGVVKWQDMVQALKDAAGDDETVGIYCLQTQPTAGQLRPIYVHAKIMIVDDIWFTVGSANAGLRSFTLDTEICVAAVNADVQSIRELDERGLGVMVRPEAANFRMRLWAEHLGISGGGLDELENPIRGADMFREAAQYNAPEPSPLKGRVFDMQEREEAGTYTRESSAGESLVAELEAAEATELARKFAPVWHFHADEVFHPTSLDESLKHGELELYGFWNDIEIKQGDLTEELMLEHNTQNHYVLFHEAQKKQKEIEKNKVVYYRAVWHTRNGQEAIALQYWLFYLDSIGESKAGKTNWISHHEGDWEFMQILLDSGKNPVSIGVSTHYYGDAAPWGDSRVVKVDGTHPKVYVANRGHGCYLEAGDYISYVSGELRFKRRDYWVAKGLDRTGAGKVWQPSDYELEDLRDKWWTDWKGHWGARRMGAAPSGPRGPRFRSPDKDSDDSDIKMWEHPLTWQAEYIKAEYTNRPK